MTALAESSSPLLNLLRSCLPPCCSSNPWRLTTLSGPLFLWFPHPKRRHLPISWLVSLSFLKQASLPPLFHVQQLLLIPEIYFWFLGPCFCFWLCPQHLGHRSTNTWWMGGKMFNRYLCLPVPTGFEVKKTKRCDDCFPQSRVGQDFYHSFLCQRGQITWPLKQRSPTFRPHRPPVGDRCKVLPFPLWE